MFKKITTVLMVMFFVMSMSTASMGTESTDLYTDDNPCDWSEFDNN